MRNLRVGLHRMESVSPDSAVVIVGPRGTGKSTLVKDLLHQHRALLGGTVISPTEVAVECYTGMLPRWLLHDQYSPVIFKQEAQLKRQLLEAQPQQQHDANAGTFLVMDDCSLFNDEWRTNPHLQQLVSDRRHDRLLFVLTLPTLFGAMPTWLRPDYVFIMRDSLTSSLRRTFDGFGLAELFLTFGTFCEVLDQCAPRFGCMVIDNTSTSGRLEDRVSWYKAGQHAPFSLCQPLYRRMTEAPAPHTPTNSPPPKPKPRSRR